MLVAMSKKVGLVKTWIILKPQDLITLIGMTGGALLRKLAR
jgi:hypothetical protein